MKNPTTLLQLSLLIATLGMALVVLGTIWGGLFRPGVVLLALGLLAAALSGAWLTVKRG